MSGLAPSCPFCGNTYGIEARFCPAHGLGLVPPKAPGDDPYLLTTVAGGFRILEQIGTGSTGRVYRAYQQSFDRQVAIKILHRDLSKRPVTVARFLREAKLLKRVAHPGLVLAIAAGELEGNGEGPGDAYLVTEFIPGRTLRQALATEDRSLPLPRALRILLRVCDAVGAAHREHVIHRDLKPENIMLTESGYDTDVVKVLDFGAARLDLTDATVLTHRGAVLGTARYAAPEVARGSPAGPPADVYSLSIMLYECLAGAPPFDGQNSVTVLLQHMQEEPPRLTSLPKASYVPLAIASVVHRNLEKSPEARSPDALALANDLRRAAAESGIPI